MDENRLGRQAYLKNEGEKKQYKRERKRRNEKGKGIEGMKKEKGKGKRKFSLTFPLLLSRKYDMKGRGRTAFEKGLENRGKLDDLEKNSL
jgi:hypothetical protein